jgi:hypothetical protein
MAELLTAASPQPAVLRCRSLADLKSATDAHLVNGSTVINLRISGAGVSSDAIMLQLPQPNGEG